MTEAVRCPACGSIAPTRPGRDRLEGLCPGCLVSFAVGEAPALKSPPVRRVPTEVAGSQTRLGNFILASKLGSGATGEVWKAWDSILGRWVALKIFHEIDREDLARFRREAEVAATLNHPHIASIHELGTDHGRHFIAMQFVDGLTLQKFPRRDRRMLVQLIRDAATAVGAAHVAGIVHRDLKPANLAAVRLPKERGGYHVYVLDFGLARRIESGDSLTATGLVLGTPAYMPPEQARGQPLDGRADVYALGATLYHLLTGRPPFTGSNVYEILKKVEERHPRSPRSLVPSIERALETIVLKCLEKDPCRRYETAESLAKDLTCWLEGEPIRARPPGIAHRLQSLLVKRKGFVLTAAAGLLGILLTGVVITSSHDRQSDARARAGAHVDVALTWISHLEELLTHHGQDHPAQAASLQKSARNELEQALRIDPEHDEALYQFGRLFLLTKEYRKSREFLTRAIQVSPRQARAYVARATLDLGEYEEQRHDSHSGTTREESAASRDLLVSIREDLERVRRVSQEMPVLRYAEGLIQFADGKFLEAAATLRLHVTAVPTDAEAWLWRGHAEIHANLNDDAMESLRRAIALRPRWASAYGLRGLARANAGLLDEALEDYDQCLRLEPGRAQIHANRGLARFSRGHYGLAFEDFQRAIQLNPGHALVYKGRGQAHFKLGRLKEALADFDKSIALDGVDAEAWSNRGAVKGELRLTLDAIKDFDTSIRLNPRYGEARVNRAGARFVLGQLQEALSDYEVALQLKSHDVDALIGRGRVFRELKRTSESLQDFSRAIELNPHSAVAFCNRAIVLADLHRHREAIEDYNESIRLDSGMAMAFHNRAASRLTLGSLNEAITDLDEAIRLNPQFAPSFMYRGTAKAEQGLHGEAIRDFDESIRLDPQCAGAFSHRGDSKSSLGRVGEALEDYSKAILLDPTRESVYCSRGKLKSQQGRQSEAIADFDRAIQLNPRYASAYVNRGVAKACDNQLDEAIKDYTKAIELNPKDWSPYSNLGLARELKGEFDQALQNYQAALDRMDCNHPVRDSLMYQTAEVRFVLAGRPELKTARMRKVRSDLQCDLGRHAEAAEGYVGLAREFPKEPVGIKSAYSAACCFAKLRERAKALDWLKKALEAGWGDAVHIEGDPDWVEFRDDPVFKKLLESLRAK